MSICCIRAVHESAHWLFTKMHGYRRDEARFSVSSNTMSQGKGSGMMGGAAPANVNISQAGQKAEDPLISFGQRPDDAGARAVDTLFGCTALLVSWADGGCMRCCARAGLRDMRPLGCTRLTVRVLPCQATRRSSSGSSSQMSRARGLPCRQRISRGSSRRACRPSSTSPASLPVRVPRVSIFARWLD